MRETLWTFSCQLYQHPNIQELLLTLQDKYGLNVNILLALLYLAHHKESLAQRQVSEYIERTQMIADKIKALRQVRREFYDPDPDVPFDDAYQLLKKAELSAEKVMLNVLEKLFELLPPQVDQQDAYSDNLNAYWNTQSDGDMPPEMLQLARQAPLFTKTSG